MIHFSSWLIPQYLFWLLVCLYSLGVGNQIEQCFCLSFFFVQVSKLYEVVPPILTELGKVTLPDPLLINLIGNILSGKKIQWITNLVIWSNIYSQKANVVPNNNQTWYFLVQEILVQVLVCFNTRNIVLPLF